MSKTSISATKASILASYASYNAIMTGSNVLETTAQQASATATATTGKRNSDSDSDTKQSFQSLIDDFNANANAVMVDFDFNRKDAFDSAAISLSIAGTYSVIGKCIDPRKKDTSERSGRFGVDDSGCNPNLLELKRSIYRDTHTTERVLATTAGVYREVSDSGVVTWKEKDSEAAASMYNYVNQNFGDGLDLVHEFYVGLIDECQKQIDRCGRIDIEASWFEERVNRKTIAWHSDVDPKDNVKEVEVTPIREAYKKVRRYINANKALNIDPTCKFTYLSYYSDDSDRDEHDRVYLRMPKYADIGGTTTDFNGAFLTAEDIDAEDMTAYRAAYDKVYSVFSPQQRGILARRIEGDSLRDIAARYHVDDSNITNQLSRMQEKAVRALGLSDSMLDKTPKKPKFDAAAKQRAYDMLMDGRTQSFIALQVGVSKMTISRWVRGGCQIA